MLTLLEGEGRIKGKEESLFCDSVKHLKDWCKCTLNWSGCVIPISNSVTDRKHVGISAIPQPSAI